MVTIIVMYMYNIILFSLYSFIHLYGILFSVVLAERYQGIFTMRSSHVHHCVSTLQVGNWLVQSTYIYVCVCVSVCVCVWLYINILGTTVLAENPFSTMHFSIEVSPPTPHTLYMVHDQCIAVCVTYIIAFGEKGSTHF